MTAPAAPTIYGHFDGAKVRLRWQPVVTATDYKVYVGAATNPSGLQDDVADDDIGADGWQYSVFRVDFAPMFIAVTALNVGAEESAHSNELRITDFGAGGSSFPPDGPHSPQPPSGIRQPFG